MSPGLQVALGEPCALRICGWKKPCWRPNRAMIAMKPTTMKASLVVPGPIAGREQVDPGQQQDDHARVDQVAVDRCTPARIAGVARGYFGATEKKNA